MIAGFGAAAIIVR